MVCDHHAERYKDPGSPTFSVRENVPLFFFFFSATEKVVPLATNMSMFGGQQPAFKGGGFGQSAPRGAAAAATAAFGMGLVPSFRRGSLANSVEQEQV